MYLVSVIIPTHNRAALVRAAIESVLAVRRDGFDVEVLVVDDDSTNETAEVIRALPVTHLRTEGIGASGARNAGLHAATGDFITFLDDDDLWLPNNVAPQLRLFAAHPDYGAVHAQMLLTDADRVVFGDPVPAGPLSSGWILDDLLTYWPQVGTLVVRAAVAQKIGDFDETLRSEEEWDWMLRIARRYPFGRVEEPVLLVRSRSYEDEAVRWRRMPYTIKVFHRNTRDYPLVRRLQLERVLWKHRGWYASQFVMSARHYAARGERARAMRCVAYAVRASPPHTVTLLARTWRSDAGETNTHDCRREPMTTQAEEQAGVIHAANERMFDATSGNYSTEQWFDHSARSPFVYDITRRRLLEALDLTGSEDVFEMGCGPGTWSRVIASRAGSLTALDISQVMIDRAREFVRPYDVSFAHGDILRYMPERAYERVVSLRAIEYVRDKPALVARLAQLVSDDGELVIISKTPFSAWRGRRAIAAIRQRFSRRPAPSVGSADSASTGKTSQAAYYHVRISPWRLAKMLRAAGFDGITIRPVIVGLPILGNAEDEGSDLPLIPPSLAPRVLRGFNALGDLLARAPQWTMPLTLWLSESYVLRAHKGAVGQPKVASTAPRVSAVGGTALLALLALAFFIGYRALKHRGTHS